MAIRRWEGLGVSQFTDDLEQSGKLGAENSMSVCRPGVGVEDAGTVPTEFPRQ